MTMNLEHDGKIIKIPVDKVHNVIFEKEYLDPDFEINTFPENKRESNGLLPIFKLTSSKLQQEFICRWDQKPEVIDIDMYVKGKLFQEFKNEKDGYFGHHTEKISEDPRKFHIYVKIPEKIICEGFITLNINHTVEIKKLDHDIYIDFKNLNKT